MNNVTANSADTSTRREFDDETRAALKALSPVDNDKALAFAEKYGFTVHQVRAVATRSDEIEYVKKPRTRKDGTAVETKAEIVENIAAALGTDAESIESLGNATRNVLVQVRDALAE